MSKTLNEKEHFSEEPKTADLNTYNEVEIKKMNIEFNIDIHDDESIDDESREVGWTNEDETKYYCKTVNIDTIKEETNDELIEEEKKDDLEIDKEIHNEENSKEEKKDVEKIDEPNKKSCFLFPRFTFIHELIHNIRNPFSK
jgi:hypothetical protein